MKKFSFSFLILLICLSAKTQSVKLTDFAEEYNWLISFAHADDDRIFAVQKNGIVVITDKDGEQILPPFLDISSKVNNSFQNEKGLLGIAFHPNYEVNRRFFAFYNSLPDGDIVIAEFETDPNNPNRAMETSEKEILSFAHPRGNHTGGCIKFGPDGYLYFAAGDGGGSGDPDKTGQDLTSYLGKIHRIDIDNGDPYSIPADNPFINDASAKKEIYAWGLRNPWRFSFDRMTGDLWIADVGQNEIEEVNFQKAGTPGGQNYGWSCREASSVFTQSECVPGTDYIDPAFEYRHVGGSCSGSISGGVVYRGMEFGDLWGKYMVTDFCTGAIYAVDNNNGTFSGRKIADFANSEYTVLEENYVGEMFITAFFSNELIKLESNNPAPTARILNDDFLICPGESVTLEAYNIQEAGMDLVWQLDGVDFLPAVNPQIFTTQPGSYTLKVTNPSNGEVSISEPVMVTIRPNQSTTTNVSAQIGDIISGVTIQGDTTFSFVNPDQFGCDSTSVFIVNISSGVNSPVSEITGLNIFPNPAENILTVDFQAVTNTNVEISVKNAQGESVTSFSERRKLNAGNHKFRKDISNLTEGIYFLTIATEKGVLLRKFIKRN